MWCRLALACSLAGVAQTFAPIVPARIQWQGVASRKFVLGHVATSRANRDANSKRTLPSSNSLLILERSSEMPPITLPKFILNPDETISLDHLGLCVEASGKDAGDAVRVAPCTGGARQKWNWVPNGRGGEMIQLKNSKMCLNVVQGGYNGAPVALADCDRRTAESWRVEDPVPSASGGYSSSSHHVAISIIPIVAIAMASLTAWMWRWLAKPRATVVNQRGIPWHENDGGVALVVPSSAPNDCVPFLDLDAEASSLVWAAMALAPIPVETSQNAIVKIYNAQQRPSWSVPWQMQPVENTTGSGVVITLAQNLFILTAAHVTSDSKYLEIQRSSTGLTSERFRATVSAVCHDVDLALLSVEKPDANLAEIEPLKVASGDELPNVSDKVLVAGYPVGGDAVSVTEGIVSRVEVQEYWHSRRPGLALTVDAAIDSGNSGGPVLDAETSEIVGVAFQKSPAKGVELQGHAVPAPLIQRFLSKVEKEIVDRASNTSVWRRRRFAKSGGVKQLDLTGYAIGASVRMPGLSCDFQKLDPVLREDVGLPADSRGLLVKRIHYASEAPLLHEGDVLLAFNGYDLDNNGCCDLLGHHLYFTAAQDLCETGSRALLTVYRDGQELMIEHPMDPPQSLVPRLQHDSVPRFFVVAGLVFEPLTENLLRRKFEEGPNSSHMNDLFLAGHLTPERTEAVVLSNVMTDPANITYESGRIGSIVREVNGKSVRDLGHFIELVRGARDKYEINQNEAYLRFEFDTATGPFGGVLNIKDLKPADMRVRELYGVPKAGCSIHYSM